MSKEFERCPDGQCLVAENSALLSGLHDGQKGNVWFLEYARIKAFEETLDIVLNESCLECPAREFAEHVHSVRSVKTE